VGEKKKPLPVVYDWMPLLGIELKSIVSVTVTAAAFPLPNAKSAVIELASSADLNFDAMTNSVPFLLLISPHLC
jgi:hypothetical protein